MEDQEVAPWVIEWSAGTHPIKNLTVSHYANSRIPVRIL